jgi:hypothetical protein
MSKCICEKWIANIEKINAPIILQAARTGTAGYDGEPFIFCPWCGEELIKKESDNE